MSVSSDYYLAKITYDKLFSELIDGLVNISENANARNVDQLREKCPPLKSKTIKKINILYKCFVSETQDTKKAKIKDAIYELAQKVNLIALFQFKFLEGGGHINVKFFKDLRSHIYEILNNPEKPDILLQLDRDQIPGLSEDLLKTFLRLPSSPEFSLRRALSPPPRFLTSKTTAAKPRRASKRPLPSAEPSLNSSLSLVATTPGPSLLSPEAQIANSRRASTCLSRPSTPLTWRRPPSSIATTPSPSLPFPEPVVLLTPTFPFNETGSVATPHHGLFDRERFLPTHFTSIFCQHVPLYPSPRFPFSVPFRPTTVGYPPFSESMSLDPIRFSINASHLPPMMPNPVWFYAPPPPPPPSQAPLVFITYPHETVAPAPKRSRTS